MTQTSKTETLIFSPYISLKSGRRASMQLNETDWAKVAKGGTFVVTDQLTSRTYLIKKSRNHYDILEEVAPSPDKPTLALLNDAGDIQRDAAYQASLKEREARFAKREEMWALYAPQYGITEKIGDIIEGRGDDFNSYKILGWNTGSKTYPLFVERMKDGRTSHTYTLKLLPSQRVKAATVSK